MTYEAGWAGFEIGKDGLGSVVVGYDGTEPSLHAAAWAAGLARREHALLLIVYVEPLNSAAYWSPVATAMMSEPNSAFTQEVVDAAGTYLTERGIAWEMLQGRGDPATVLEKIAEERHADCVVVGKSRRRGGLLGTVPKNLLSRARRPVVVVP
jgi:nucleotide-binding universal stress UspA family protein